MAKHDILLVCGSGASSGFMAANIRKAASARGLEWNGTERIRNLELRGRHRLPDGRASSRI